MTVARDRRSRSSALGLAAAVGVSVCLAGQSPSAPPLTLSIQSPVNGAYASGPVTLRATVEPADAASAVIFFVDGRQMCVDCGLLAPPTETNFTLISQRHGWRLTRHTDPSGKRSLEWRCPKCYSLVKEKQGIKR